MPKTNSNQQLADLLDDEHSAIVSRIEALDKVLLHLRFEGKACRGKNLRDAQELLSFFNHNFLSHMKIEEEIVYPFISLHLPKLEAAVNVLISEHAEIQNKLKEVNQQFVKIERSSKSLDYEVWLDEAEAVAAYFVRLVKNHLKAEVDCVFKTFSSHMRKDEIQEIAERLEKCG